MVVVVLGSLPVLLAVAMCYLYICSRHDSDSVNSSDVDYSTPNKVSAEDFLNMHYRTSAWAASNVIDPKTASELTYRQSSYSTIDKPIYTVQNELKTPKIHGRSQDYAYLPQVEFRTLSVPSVRTTPSIKYLYSVETNEI